MPVSKFFKLNASGTAVDLSAGLGHLLAKAARAAVNDQKMPMSLEAEAEALAFIKAALYDEIQK